MYFDTVIQGWFEAWLRFCMCQGVIILNPNPLHDPLQISPQICRLISVRCFDTATTGHFILLLWSSEKQRCIEPKIKNFLRVGICYMIIIFNEKSVQASIIVG